MLGFQVYCIVSFIFKEFIVTDKRYKEIMKKLGMPDSQSLLDALCQVANETAQEHLEKKRKMKVALKKIANWELPTTGEFVDEERTIPASYGFLYGSNGERDYMRNIAKEALGS